MTRFDPSLVVRRMVVLRDGRPVYDERFHLGVNVIRGENSSGKSTILNFIHYGIGGDVHEWSETALLCDQVLLEVSLSGNVATLKRHVSAAHFQPMEIFHGSYERAALAGVSQWERYPYRRSESKESFSQIVFRLMGIPEAASEDSGNITLHQVMRLLYADQLSPVEDIFSHERFDNAKIREAVGRLLCGAFDNELYGNELEIRVAEKKFSQVSMELSGLYRLLGGSGHDLTKAWVDQQIENIEFEKGAAHERIAELQRSKIDSEPLTLNAQVDARANVVSAQESLSKLMAERDSVTFSIADSERFMHSLQEKLESLKDASLVSETLGDAHFSCCPSCYSELGPAEDRRCGLCKSTLDSDERAERIGGLINEVSLQLRQSRLLQERREEKLNELERDVHSARIAWRSAASVYDSVVKAPMSDSRQEISELYKKLGYLERQIEDLAEKARNIDMVSALSSQKIELNSKISGLKERNQQLLSLQRSRLDTAYLAISEDIRWLLTQDLKRQDSFESPRKVDFSFTDNRISVDGHTYFSASSRAILKSSFVLGFFSAALKHKFFRHPRFIMMDTIEDKGMEPQRSQNFQRLAAEVCGRSDVQGQVIFATAMIAPELDSSEFTVGRSYTREDRALELT